MTPTILYSTTRTWNPGDEFILFGVRNLINDLLPQHNALIWDRNPDLHPQLFFRTVDVTIERGQATEQHKLPGDLILKPFANRSNNSWRPKHGLDHVDYCIFAGTPEWLGSMVSPLTEAVAASAVPVAYLGVGAFEGIWNFKIKNFPANDRRLLERAALVTARDRRVATMLAPLPVTELPCPALFAAPDARIRDGKRIALCVSSGVKGARQPIARNSYDFALALYRRLAEKYDCALVCHYSEEVAHLRGLLPETVDIRYSYDAGDYAAIYDDFDLTVTTRVHGAGMCASLGIPGFVIAHSARTDTVRGFLSEILDPTKDTIDAVVARIDGFDVAQASAALVAHKQQTKSAYQTLLKGFFAG